jgi:tetratricopeptide (TPR) repeat protein
MIKQTPPSAPDSRPVHQIPSPPDRLESWKEIAQYLCREVRTVQLWEKREGLPIHRHFHHQLGSVFAFRSEIDEWRRRASKRFNGPDNSRAATSQAQQKNGDGVIEIRLLPLENRTGNTDLAHLCDLLVVRTISALSQIKQYVVVDFTSSFPKKNNICSDIRGAEATTYELRWSLEQRSAALQLNITLLSRDDGSPVWSDTHRCSTENIEYAAAQAADQMVQCLWLKLSAAPARLAVTGERDKTGARVAYLKGRYFWNQRTEASLRKAMRYFQTATNHDPAFAPAYSGLADSLTLLSFYEIVPPLEVMPSARRAALKAIELDPDLAEGHASLADIYLHFDRDWHAADSEYRRSIECNPGYALGYHWYANLLAARGQHEAAHLAVMQALEIDPVSIITVVWAGVTSHLAHRFDEAIKHYRYALELDPQFIWAHMYMAQALEQNGDFKGALREFEATIRLARGNHSVKAMMAHAYAAAGDRSCARDLLRELKRGSPTACKPSYDIAATYAALGDSHRAVLWLNRACDERSMKLFTLGHDPRFDPLRHSSEFRKIVQQVTARNMLLGPAMEAAHGIQP